MSLILIATALLSTVLWSQAPLKETRDGIKVTSMTTGFSPVTAYSDEQVSPQTLYDVLGSLEQTQAVQRQAVHKAVISGDGARADRYKRSHDEAEHVKREIQLSGGRNLSKTIQEIPTMVPQWAPTMLKSMIAKNVKVGDVILESAALNRDAALEGKVPCSYPTSP